jgi:trehalose 6-phosphate phosphatase
MDETIGHGSGPPPQLVGIEPSSLLVASDFDGTLSEIVERPRDARPRPEALDALRRLAGRVAGVVVISGRSTAALERLLPVEGLRRLGDYGLGEATDAERAALDELELAARSLADATPGTTVERKPGSLSVHYRGAPGSGPDLERALGGPASTLGLRVRRGRMVLEALPARAEKSLALAAEIDRTRAGAVVFAGDDTGDRGCFELMSRLAIPHLAVGVGSTESSPGLFDACDAVLDGPEEWARLLSRLAGWAERRAPAGRGAGG